MHEESIDLSEGVRRIARWSFKLKIDKLTSEQEGRLPDFIEGWTKIVLCADPGGRPRAEAAVRYTYRSAGLRLPSKIVRFAGRAYSRSKALAGKSYPIDWEMRDE